MIKLLSNDCTTLQNGYFQYVYNFVGTGVRDTNQDIKLLSYSYASSGAFNNTRALCVCAHKNNGGETGT